MKRNAYMRIVILLLVFALTIPLVSCVGEIREDDSTHESESNDSTEGTNEQTDQGTEGNDSEGTSSDNSETSGSQNESTDSENDSSIETNEEDSDDNTNNETSENNSENSSDESNVETTDIDTDSGEVTSDETEGSEQSENNTDETEEYASDETESSTVAPCSHEYEYDCSDLCSLCDEPRRDDYADHSWLFVSGTADLLTGGSMVLECTACATRSRQSTEQPLNPELLGMPVIYIDDYVGGEIPLVDLEKENGEINVKYKYVSNDPDIDDFDCYCKIKIQGASSSTFIKKNFTVKFYKDADYESKFKVNLGWGKENKYCMKANYIDFSQSRNIVAAQMFAQVVATRDNIAEGLKNAPNYGAIDGYPVLVYINEEFHGIYTMNIPKDSWQFAMEGEEDSREALLMADGWADSVALRTEIGEFSDEPGAEKDWAYYCWEVEHCSTDDESWIRDSFNSLIRLLNCGDGERIRAELANHLDIEAAIDNMIFTFFINARDNTSKNILWATYDGQVWIPSMYDMDGTFGLYWNGQPIGTTTANGAPRDDAVNTYPYYKPSGSISDISGVNRMWEILIKYFPNEVEARYDKLRTTVLTELNTQAMFNAFCNKIHSVAYNSDYKKWNGMDNNNTAPYDFARVNKTSMLPTTLEQLERLDDFFYNIRK